MSKYDVVIKNVEAVKVASVRDVVPTPPEQGGLWGELEGYLAMHRVRPSGPASRSITTRITRSAMWIWKSASQLTAI